MANLTTVRLYIYDISHGLGSTMGASLLGKHIDGVWHTGVGVYGREYLYGSSGVSYTAPEEIFRLGLVPRPQIKDLGQTKKSLGEIEKWVREKSSTSFEGYRYELLDWNCNNFSDEFTKFLLDSSSTIMPEEILELPRFIKTTPIGRMLMSFLNKDPISMAQQTGSSNSFVDNPVHMIPSNANKSDHIPVRHCILPILDKIKPRIGIIRQMLKRKLTSNEEQQLDDINQLFIPNATYSPMLSRDHVILLISLMVNSIEDEIGQQTVLELLQLLSEYEYIVKIIGELKGQESPIDLLKGLSEQPESIQIEFLRWFSAIAATSNGRTHLIEVQDDLAPLFTDTILNETSSKRVKYEIIVVLHNLLCINADIRLSFMNSISIGSAIVQYMSSKVNDNEAEAFLAVFIALAAAENDIYGIAQAMEFNIDAYSSIVSCQPLIETIKRNFGNVK